MRDLTNTIFGEYRLLRMLGQSAFTGSSVYLGEHIYLKTQIAIKILQIPLSEADRDNFRKEARLLTKIRHPHIVAAHTYDVDDIMPFIVMNYAPNGTLRHRYPTGTRLSNEEIIRYVTQVADALQYLHDHENLIHCDIKPENMLLGPNDEVWLSDFGTAIAASTSPLAQSQEEISATVQYLAPEQAQGEPCIATDQYALGVVVYEWLSGTFPFNGPAAEIPLQHIYDPPPSLRAKVPTISPAAEMVVFKALAKDPQQRFSSVQDFADALQVALKPASYPASTKHPIPAVNPLSPALQQTTLLNQEEPALPLPTPSVEIKAMSEISPFSQANLPGSPAAHETPVEAQAQPPSQKSSGSQPQTVRRAVVLGLASLVIALGGGGLLFEHFHASTKPAVQGNAHTGKQATASPTEAPVLPTATPGTTLYTYRGHSQPVKGVAWLSNQLVASGSLDKTVRIWHAVTGQTSMLYSRHSTGVRAIAVAPGGKTIASGDGSGMIRVWNISNGIDRFAPLYDGQPAAVRSITWSPDGRSIASGSDDSTARLWDAQTGRLFFTYLGHNGSILGISWSPDGQWLASASDDHTVQVWSATNKSQQARLTYTGHTQRVWDVAWSPDGKRIASASQDGTVQIWNATNGALIASHTVPAGKAESVAWSPHGQYIAGGTDDGTVFIWNAQTAQLTLSYHRQSSTIWSLPWSPDGLFIASASSDSTVQVWQAHTGTA
jgi:WD40 repeat protein/tRNA A-37 threonylcarbamoyl transferase component Bud32